MTMLKIHDGKERFIKLTLSGRIITVRTFMQPLFVTNLLEVIRPSGNCDDLNS